MKTKKQQEKASYSIKMSNGCRYVRNEDEIISFAKDVAKTKKVPCKFKSIQEALGFLVELDSRNRYYKIGDPSVCGGKMYATA